MSLHILIYKKDIKNSTYLRRLPVSTELGKAGSMLRTVPAGVTTQQSVAALTIGGLQVRKPADFLKSYRTIHTFHFFLSRLFKLLQ